MRDIDQDISNVILILADVSERFQPMLPQRSPTVPYSRSFLSIQQRLSLVACESH